MRAKYTTDTRTLHLSSTAGLTAAVPPTTVAWDALRGRRSSTDFSNDFRRFRVSEDDGTMSGINHRLHLHVAEALVSSNGFTSCLV